MSSKFKRMILWRERADLGTLTSRRGDSETVTKGLSKIPSLAGIMLEERIIEEIGVGLSNKLISLFSSFRNISGMSGD